MPWASGAKLKVAEGAIGMHDLDSLLTPVPPPPGDYSSTSSKSFNVLRPTILVIFVTRFHDPKNQRDQYTTQTRAASCSNGIDGH